MKKPQRVRRKARFYKGQVVARRGSEFLFRVESRRQSVGGVWQYLTPHYRQYDEDELRPLTAKEIGPRRERGQ